MKNLRWQLLVVGLALLVIVGLLLSQRKANMPGAESGDSPVSGGTYTEALIGLPSRYNPLFDYYNQVDYDVDALIFSSLVKFDHRGVPYGDLALDWGIAQDGKKYNFAIRQEAVWHDGTPVTSQDVIFTVQLLQDPKNPLPLDIKAFWRQVQVEGIDDKLLQFRLPEPFAPFLDYLTFGILPYHILKGMTAEDLTNSPFNLSPIGSGPFQFQGLEVQDGKIMAVVLRKFNDYYEKKPYLDELIFRYYTDATGALFAFKEGEVLGISQLPPTVLLEALKEKNLNIYSSRLPRMSMVIFNLANQQLPFFQDVTFRKALLRGLNRRWMIDKLMQGQAILANGPIFPENWAYYEAAGLVEYDPEAALAMLKQAGYSIPAEGGSVREKDGARLSFQLVHPDDELNSSIAERIRLDWEKLGVEVTLVSANYEDLLKVYLEPRAFQAALVEFNFERFPDPDPYPFWHQAQAINGQNYSGWNDRQVSEYLEQARINADLMERMRRYRNFQVRFSADMPALPLFYPVYSYAVDARVRGLKIGPLYDLSDRFLSITAWYLTAGPVVQVQETP